MLLCLTLYERRATGFREFQRISKDADRIPFTERCPKTIISCRSESSKIFARSRGHFLGALHSFSTRFAFYRHVAFLSIQNRYSPFADAKTVAFHKHHNRDVLTYINRHANVGSACNLIKIIARVVEQASVVRSGACICMFYVTPHLNLFIIVSLLQAWTSNKF